MSGKVEIVKIVQSSVAQPISPCGMRRESVIECVFGEAFVGVVLSCYSLVCPFLDCLLMEVSFDSGRHSSESNVRRRIMAELPLNLAHLLDLVWVGVGARSERLIVLDSEIDTLYRVFTREHSDLVGGWVLEARRG